MRISEQAFPAMRCRWADPFGDGDQNRLGENSLERLIEGWTCGIDRNGRGEWMWQVRTDWDVEGELLPGHHVTWVPVHQVQLL